MYKNTHILCAATCAHSFCNKHRLFVRFLIPYVYLHVVGFFFSFSSSFSSTVCVWVCCCWCLYVGRFLCLHFAAAYSSFFFNFWCTAAFGLHQIASDTFRLSKWLLRIFRLAFLFFLTLCVFISLLWSLVLCFGLASLWPNHVILRRAQKNRSQYPTKQVQLYVNGPHWVSSIKYHFFSVSHRHISSILTF